MFMHQTLLRAFYYFSEWLPNQSCTTRDFLFENKLRFTHFSINSHDYLSINENQHLIISLCPNVEVETAQKKYLKFFKSQGLS